DGEDGAAQGEAYCEAAGQLVVDVAGDDLAADQANAERAEGHDQGGRGHVGEATLGGERGGVGEDRVELERRDELAVLPGGAHRIQDDRGASDAGGDVHEAAGRTGGNGSTATT